MTDERIVSILQNAVPFRMRLNTRIANNIAVGYSSNAAYAVKVLEEREDGVDDDGVKTIWVWNVYSYNYVARRIVDQTIDHVFSLIDKLDNLTGDEHDGLVDVVRAAGHDWEALLASLTPDPMSLSDGNHPLKEFLA